VEIKKGTIVVIIPWQDIAVVEDGFLVKKESWWKVNVVNGPRGSLFRGRELIPLFNLPEKDQKLSPEKAFQKYLQRIIAKLAIISKDAP